MFKSKYVVDSSPQYRGVNGNLIYADLYIIEEPSCNEFYCVVSGKAVTKDSITGFEVTFKDVYERTVNQVYNKELFDAIYEESIKIFNTILDERNKVG
jgi:hypothetical protein